jgi:hypothetical protein
MLYQIVGSKAVGTDSGAVSAIASVRANPNMRVVPAIPIRNPRRDGKTASSVMRCRRSAIGTLAKLGRRLLYGLSDTDISHAPA